MAAPLVIGLDVGGTKILSGLVDRDGNVVAEHEVHSPGQSEGDVLAALDAAVEDFLDDRVAAIGYGIPANLERGTARILRATNLPLENVDLVSRSKDRFGLPVGVENDGSVAALAEWKRGAGRGVSNLVMLTLGTGVGGGIVLDGRLFRGWAELGHMVVQEGGPVCACGGRGHLEVLASGHAGDRAARDLYGPDADAHGLIDKARTGDARARAALARIGESLGAAVGSLVNVFDPEIVVIGGGFGAAAGELLLEPARAAARREAMPPADETLRVVAAELGAEAGLVGAALVGFEALDGVR
ncbi:MAG: ROK family protein [Thermoleophilia bacterium]|nr:ROK family protein [Thermoleophilia bacterium]MDH5281573.1 ROK family protein [Thermoleophilia bacterium]